MKIKTLKQIVAVTALAAACVINAKATLTLTIDDGAGGGPTTTIFDNLPGDGNSVAGGITQVNVNYGVWFLTINSGLTKNILGSATEPIMSLNFQAQSTGAGTLKITFAEDGLSGGGFGPLPSNVSSPIMSINGVNNAGTVSYKTTVNTSSGTIGSLVGANYNATTTYLATGLITATPWAMLQEITITHTGSGFTAGDASLLVPVPEPTTMVAGALLLLPFGVSAIRILRKNREIAV